MSSLNKYYTGAICCFCFLLGTGISFSGFASTGLTINNFETNTCSQRVLADSMDQTISDGVKQRLVDIGVTFSQRLRVDNSSDDGGLGEYIGYVRLGAQRLNGIENQVVLTQVQKSMINVVSNFLKCQGNIVMGDDFNFIQVVLNGVGSEDGNSGGNNANGGSSLEGNSEGFVDYGSCDMQVSTGLVMAEGAYGKSKCIKKCEEFKIKNDLIHGICKYKDTNVKNFGDGANTSNNTNWGVDNTSNTSSGGPGIGDKECIINFDKFGPTLLTKTNTQLSENICKDLCDSSGTGGIDRNKTFCVYGNKIINTYNSASAIDETYGNCVYKNSSGGSISSGNMLKSECIIDCTTQSNGGSGVCEHNGNNIKTYGASITNTSSSIESTSSSSSSGGATLPKTKIINGLNCSYSESNVVAKWYYDIGRCPDDAGLEYWENSITQRMNQNSESKTVAQGIIRSTFDNGFKNQVCGSYSNYNECFNIEFCGAGYDYIRNTNRCELK